jgi:hypothetical protein
MSQVAWQKKVTPAWFVKYETLAATAIEEYWTGYRSTLVLLTG